MFQRSENPKNFFPANEFLKVTNFVFNTKQDQDDSLFIQFYPKAAQKPFYALSFGLELSFLPKDLSKSTAISAAAQDPVNIWLFHRSSIPGSSYSFFKGFLVQKLGLY